ncbi:hypothetical protein ABZV29_16795 [Streptomyces sp. NPDC005236]|uniref:hypothetical protein n=1 Tax=Streptomyces sp. NPDC005236 TaxID=3157028 RepID=UPI0033AA01CE
MTDQLNMLPIALHGFHLARQRYLTQLDGGEPEEVLVISAMEVIYWSCTLDEQLEHRDTWYRGTQEYGRSILKGTRYARNRATHQLPMLLESNSGIQAPLRAPLRVEEIVWLPIAQLPQPDRPPGRGQAENYELHLAGKPVRHTLDAIAAWFAAEQNRPGSPIEVGAWDAVEG